MHEFKVVSIDMFRTLVDLETVENEAWHAVLGGYYTQELAAECAARAGNSLFKHMPPNKFITAKSIFESCFGDFFLNKGLDLDPAEAAKVWASRHRMSRPFSDSVPFLRSVGAKYPICLASDADDDMIGQLDNMYAFDHIFTSEQVGWYKANGDGRFFDTIVRHYGLRSNNILHIGDGRSEVLGAKKAGLATCWLNRTKSTWSHEDEPDFEVASLLEATAILGVSIRSANR